MNLVQRWNTLANKLTHSAGETGSHCSDWHFLRRWSRRCGRKREENLQCHAGAGSGRRQTKLAKILKRKRGCKCAVPFPEEPLKQSRRLCQLSGTGKVMFDLDGQVLENPSNPFKGTRSLDTEQGDSYLHREAVSLDARALSAKYSYTC